MVLLFKVITISRFPVCVRVRRWQHPQHPLLWDIWDQDGPHESVWPATLVLLPVSTCCHPGEPHHVMSKRYFCFSRNAKKYLWTIIIIIDSCPLSSLLQPDVYPGNCWAFKGSQGYLVIRLSLRILPTSFCVEHIPKALSPTGNITSAPRNFTVFVRNMLTWHLTARHLLTQNKH